MPAFLKDAAAFISIAGFVLTVGLWTDFVRAIA
jgi:hypothetical protein